MATSNPAFLRAWGNDDVRAALLAHLDGGALCSLRLASAECCRLSTPALFAHTRLTFTPSALSRPARMEALARVGHHVQKLTFSMAHTPSTFLPPLLSPADGREIQFLYEPRGPASGWPKYAAQRLNDDFAPSDLGDILTQQYPPIFHAATNVPSFVRALTCMPNLRHLAVSCPDQEPTQRYRRDAVDYALVSLRMAVERAPLPRLEKLTLRTVHPAALLYLRHMPGLGSSPAAGRRWAQIRKLKLVVDSWDFHGPQPGLDHLKIVDDYVRSFAGRLEKLSVTWNGPAGPCPLTLGTSPLFRPPRAAGKLFAEVTSSMSPLPAVPPKPAMRFPRLKYLQVRNCTMTASQMAVFLAAHLETVREFDFQDIVFQGAGSWREAVAPLKRPGVFEAWQSSLRSLGLGGPPRPEADEFGYETYRNHVTPAGRDEEARDEARDEPQPAPRQSLQLTKASHLLKKHRVRRRRKPRPETDTDTNTSAADRSPPRAAAAAPLRPQISAPILLAGPAVSVPAVSAPAVSAPAIAPPAPPPAPRPPAPLPPATLPPATLPPATLPPATLQPTTYSPPPPDARHRSPPPPRPPPSFCGTETPRSLFLPFALPLSPPPPDVRRRPPPPPLAAPLAPVPLPPRSSVYSTETPRSLFLPFSLPLSPPMTPPSPAGPMPRLSAYSPAPLSPSPFPRSPTLASLPSAAASAVDSAVTATPAASALSVAPPVPAGPPPSPPRSKARSHLRRLSATIASVNPNRNPVGIVAGHHGSPSNSPTPPSSSGSGGGNTSAASANSNGVQRNLVLEATHQSLADDAEKRISTLRKAREAILTKLTREFCTSNTSSHPANLGSSAAYSAGSSGLVVDSGPGVRRKGTIGRLRLGAGANVESRRAAPGEQSSKTQLVPLMIFR